jgi:DNA-binding CsgD family transcriptional regulator
MTPLSKREQEVYDRKGRGMNDREIAIDLEISETYVRQLMARANIKKLGINPNTGRPYETAESGAD